MSKLTGDLPAKAVLLLLAGACGRTGISSRDGAVSDLSPMVIESGRIEPDGPLSISDVSSDPVEAATESGARDVDALPSDVETARDAAIDTREVGPKPDAATDAPEVVASPDAATDSRDLGSTTLDLGADRESDAGNDVYIPTNCAGQDLFVDLVDVLHGRGTSTRLAYSAGSAIPLVVGSGDQVVVDVSQEPNGKGATLYVEIDVDRIGGRPQTSDIARWNPTGASTTMTNYCRGLPNNVPVTITRFDAGGGIFEGEFSWLGFFESWLECETLDASLDGHFRVCYIPTS
jgi:hypothetical protein